MNGSGSGGIRDEANGMAFLSCCCECRLHVQSARMRMQWSLDDPDLASFVILYRLLCCGDQGAPYLFSPCTHC